MTRVETSELDTGLGPERAADAIARGKALRTDESSRQEPLERYRRIRSWTEHLAEPLETEDYVVQSMPDASPTKWHMAHTTWFFEIFLVAPNIPGWQPPNPTFHYLFNSYYNSLGKQYFRPDRGVISRPTVAEVYDYRRRIDEAMVRVLGDRTEEELGEIAGLLDVGLNHEQQHQELILTDLQHMLSKNPLFPVYLPAKEAEGPLADLSLQWLDFDGGLVEIGHEGATAANGHGNGHGEGGAFAYDNEGPRHKVYLEPFRLASRPVTWREYLEFMADGGYRRPELWLSDGWTTVRAEGWKSPLYWLEEDDGSWSTFDLTGKASVRPDAPACHLSFYEADAFARWAGARLPTEAEWEVAAEARLRGPAYPLEISNLAEREHYRPMPATAAGEPYGQLLGDVWEWTRSAYSPYPGYTPPEGALGEYNAKFMNNQVVLRGGSCATPRSHIRTTYRNFFPPPARWQFTGLRLAKDGLVEGGGGKM